ncbi:MAG: Quaternary ammonium compound-resistance protein SugE [Candidatus Carbobacillus altaicus]|uniref:Quaternary ammonium compound-resistance protein SugE n=1 Tax=Candidatus Carbonibacillus altaicus TaxID=2163959 RepID=A0A2R6XZC4_9BACL|nr:MAG: Quaternary ammonium compound-resistance protein SugE [Candidatus Carbobacillus altaicus]
MAWIYVMLAGVVEIFWVIGLRYSVSVVQWLGTVVAIILSFYFIIKATEKLPAGTVYAVFTGIGSTGIVLMDYLFFDAELSLAKLLLIGLIVTGVIGLKMTSAPRPEEVSHTKEPS